MVPFAACLMFELHNIQGKYHVKIFYRNDDKKPAKLLYESTLDAFKANYRHIMPAKSFDDECGPIRDF